MSKRPLLPRRADYRKAGLNQDATEWLSAIAVAKLAIWIAAAVLLWTAITTGVTFLISWPG